MEYAIQNGCAVQTMREYVRLNYVQYVTKQTAPPVWRLTEQATSPL